MSPAIKAAAVWIVTGEKYVPWAMASAATFHAHHREMPLIWLASDSAARKANELVPDWLRDSLDVRVAAHSGEPDREASRRLKVEARRLIEGDFFQIDADVLLARPLQRADFEKVEAVGAAPNREPAGEFEEDPDNKYAQAFFREMGWQWPDTYLNTGFIFWRDNEAAHAFTQAWEKAREEFAAKMQIVIDQPAFNHVADLSGSVTTLDSRYNAPVSLLPQLTRNAVCYHYYASDDTGEAVRGSALVYLAGKFATKSSDAKYAVERFVKAPKPFVGWGAHSEQYRLAGQWRNYLERKLRVGWDGAKRRLKAET